MKEPPNTFFLIYFDETGFNKDPEKGKKKMFIIEKQKRLSLRIRRLNINSVSFQMGGPHF